MKLTTEIVEQLMEIKAQKAKYEELEKDLVERIKKVMKHDKIKEFGPTDSPMKLVYSKFKKSAVSWKAEWKILAKKVYGKKWNKVQEDLIEAFKEPATSLCLELNDKYKGKK